MTYRVLFRMSLNKDSKSAVRNAIEATLAGAKLVKRKGRTATWEANGLDPAALQTVAGVLKALADPTRFKGASAKVTVDHVWLYVDRDIAPPRSN